MVLRELQDKDAVYMLEWMHDENVYTHLGRDFSSMTIEDCRNFIASADYSGGNGRHYAIVNEEDEYMGTISLKNIDWEQKRAEYAISCRSKAMGQGYSARATQELFVRAKELNLELIYLYVKESNVRANRFYEKMGFELTKKPEFIEEEMDASLNWFSKKL